MEVAMESIHHYVQGDTFTCVARCGETRMLGVAQATSSIAVASRCPMAKARVGALAVQACPDPRLRLLGMKLLEIGYSASKVVKELRESDPAIHTLNTVSLGWWTRMEIPQHLREKITCNGPGT
jgi:hypothetical protein